MSHTPGPWKAVFIQGDKEVSERELDKDEWYNSEISANNGKATLCTADYHMSEDAANFQLMAAAPDLLSALKEYLEEDDGCLASSNARAAIAKAEGK